MDYKWSVFNFIVKSEKNIIIKNMLNGAIVKLEKEVYENINKYVDDGLKLKEDNKKIFKILKEQEIILLMVAILNVHIVSNLELIEIRSLIYRM